MFNPQTVSRLTHLWCGIVVFSSIGCQTYSPYGYGNYPGNYGTPVYTQSGQPVPYGSPGMPPGAMVGPPPGGFQGTYPPPGGFPPGYQGAPPPGTVTPATPFPNVPNGPLPRQGADVSSDGLGAQGQFPGASTNAPLPNVPAGADKSVPNYSDPNEPNVPRRPPAATPDITDEANFRGGGNNGSQEATQRLKQEEAIPGKAGASFTGNRTDEIMFAPPPKQRNPRSAQSGIIQTAQHVEAGSGAQQLRPYGRAPNGQDWFRGLIDFDEQENLWYLIYNPEPDIRDPQGGIITLIEHPHLSLLQGDDVVLIEGQFDLTQLDANNRPKYRANSVRRLVP